MKKSLNVSGDNDLETRDNDSTEGQKKKLKYPRSIPFIIGNEFCERFNYYGMRTILVLYLSKELMYSDDDATIIFHVFTMLVYFLCTLGAIIADSWLGKFRTILYLSIVYVAGSVLISLGAVTSLKLPATEITMVALFLIALGSGGIKPCVAAFGGDQFKLPEQVKQMAWFFSLFYFSINAGSLISTTVTPILRENVRCFGAMSCYPLAFGIPAILMAISIVVFVIGKPLYLVKPPAGNMFVKVTKAIGCAISSRIKRGKQNHEHWLYYAEWKYDSQLLDDIKVLLRVLVLYIPLPVFWALFDQQGSRWTFQASRMDGTLGETDIKPDQMQMINPLLILIFIPLYEAFFYPLLAKCGISRPLQKLFCGGVLAGIAFVVSGVIDLELEKTYPILPQSTQSELRIYNGIPNCNYVFDINYPKSIEIKLEEFGGYYEQKEIDISKNDQWNWEISAEQGCPTLKNKQGQFNFEKGKSISYFLRSNGSSSDLEIYEYIDYIDKPSIVGIRYLTSLPEETNIIFKDNGEEIYKNSSGNSSYFEIPAARNYEIFSDSKSIKKDVTIKQGAVYTILISSNDGNEYHFSMIETTTANSFHILWLIPQYFIMTLGEVMFSVTGLEFSYAQAPPSMKSVLQACWLLTVALGNLIVVIIAGAKIFNSQAYEFFLFAGLMFVDMILFSWLAYRYVPNDPSKNDREDDSEITASPIDESNDKNKKGNNGVNPAFVED